MLYGERLSTNVAFFSESAEFKKIFKTNEQEANENQIANVPETDLQDHVAV